MVDRYSPYSMSPTTFEPTKTGAWVRYSDHEAELAPLRARVEELEREVNALLSNAAAKGDEPDLLLTEWKEAKARAERAEDAFEIANNMRLEATRLAVEALECVADIAKRNLGHQTEKLYDIEPVARTALDRLSALSSGLEDRE